MPSEVQTGDMELAVRACGGSMNQCTFDQVRMVWHVRPRGESRCAREASSCGDDAMAGKGPKLPAWFPRLRLVPSSMASTSELANSNEHVFGRWSAWPTLTMCSCIHNGQGVEERPPCQSNGSFEQFVLKIMERMQCTHVVP